MISPIESTPTRVSDICGSIRASGKKVAFVPTMGALHEGHLSLVNQARAAGDVVVVSIFVNPKQFGPSEDLDKYPKNLAADQEKLSKKGVELIFAPSPAEMYPPGFATEVKIPKGVTVGFCGAKRPGHFDGVATVVTKLLNIVGPCFAVFGRKDYQQLQVIKRLVADLNLPVHIIEGPTVRESDGLAMSSRNVYLTPEERVRALAIPGALTAAHVLFNQSSNSNPTVGELLTAVKTPIEAAADSVDYITAADPETLIPLQSEATAPPRLLIAAAAFFGATRLIDNTVLGEDAPPQ